MRLFKIPPILQLFVTCLFLLLPSPSLADQQGLVAILLSADVPAYEKPAQEFQIEYGGPVRQFTLKGSTSAVPTVMSEVMAAKPALILAFGARAAYAARLWTGKEQQIPVLFAQAINWRHFRLLEGQSNMAGIDTVSAAGSELAYLTLFAPKVRRVGILYSKRSEHVARGIQKAAAIFGVEVKLVSIEDPRHFRYAYKKLVRDIDAFIALRDPKIYNLENLEWLTRRCLRDNLVCLGRTPELAQKGSLLTVSPGPRDIALQAVSLTRAILSGQTTPEEVGVVAPLGMEVVLNLETAQALDLTISPEARRMATVIIKKLGDQGSLLPQKTKHP